MQQVRLPIVNFALGISRFNLDILVNEIGRLLDTKSNTSKKDCCKYKSSSFMIPQVSVCLLLCKIVDFCKVYWSPRSVCLSICLSVRDVQDTPLDRAS